MMSNELWQIGGQMAQRTNCTLYSIVLVGVGMRFISSASTEESQQSYAYQKTKTAMQINMHTDLLIIATPNFCVHENINISSVYLCAYTSNTSSFEGRQKFCHSVTLAVVAAVAHSVGFQRHMLYTQKSEIHTNGSLW